MSGTHAGNVQNEVTLEEHDGTNNAKRIINALGPSAWGSLASISTSAVVIVASNENRLSVLLRNISNTTVFINFVSNATTSTMYMRQDDTLIIDRYKGSIYSLVAAGSGEVRFFEENRT